MARKHVFPLCQDGASKTYTPLNKKDGGKSLQLGNALYSETEDPDIIFSENTNTNSYSFQYLYLSKDKTEYLLDLTEAPETDLAVIDGQETLSIEFPNQGGTGKVPNLWEDINNKAKEEEFPTPGQIVCIGRKKSSDAAWNDTTFVSFYIYDGILSDENRALFQDSKAGLVQNKLDTAGINDGEWSTFMWTGERFVALGSNNWI